MTTFINLVKTLTTSGSYLWSASVQPWQEALPWQYTGAGGVNWTNISKT